MLPQSPGTGRNSDGGNSNFRIFGQPLLKKIVITLETVITLT